MDGNIEAWKALEDAYKAGKIRAIGIEKRKGGDRRMKEEKVVLMGLKNEKVVIE